MLHVLHVRNEQAEIAALREELAQEKQRSQQALAQEAARSLWDARKEVCCVVVCLLHAQLQIFRLHQNVQHRNWYLYLCILCMRLRSRNVRGRNDLVVFLDATQERQKEPASLKLDVVCLCWHAWAVVLNPRD